MIGSLRPLLSPIIINRDMKYRWICLLVLVAGAGFLSFSLLENPLERLVAGFKKYLDELPQEKVYLHFDRPCYASGETIWFKAYLTSGADHKPSTLSHVIYVELIDEGGRLVSQLKLFSRNGSAAGTFALADSLSSGNYLVRAYTNWMKNGEEDYFFHRSIRILNTVAKPLAASVEVKPLDIKFFPEGGDLVYGISSKVGIKVVGADGRGRKIKGEIVDESNKIICEFKSNHLGMGAFSFLPQKGKTYKVIVENQPEINLPSIKESGLVMVVDNISDSSSVLITLKTSDYKQLGTINILAQTRGLVCFAARTNLSANLLKAKIPKLKFPDGVAQITITDSNGIPLAERLVFINNEEQLNVDITSDKVKYAPRELVTLKIKAKDYNEEPVAADFSLAVCSDSQVLTDDNRETITTYLLLSSDLRGFIESPGYYFNPTNKDRAEALDYLLLTQGWRRFSLTKAMESEWQKPQFEIEAGLSIKGKMVGKYNNKPVANGKVTYLPFAHARDIKVVQTNSAGDFVINDLIYFDYVKALLQGETEKGNNRVKFVIDRYDFSPSQFPMFPLTGKLTERDEKIISETSKEVVDKSTNAIMLKEVEVVRPRENFDRSLYGKGSVNEQVAGKLHLENLIHPLQLLQGVPGVQVFGGGQDWLVLVRGGDYRSSSNTPLLMIDNMPVDITALNMIPVHDIESFIVWKGVDASIFGTRGANGVIVFFTKQGASSGSPPADGVQAFNEMGFQVEREFYSPKYDVTIPDHQKLDNRTTLFWASHIQTNNEGVATVSFYNHDVETNVTAVLEGISTEGTPGAATVKYEIKKN